MLFLFTISILRYKYQNSQNLKLDPPFWFSCLKNSEFLLTINGTNIGNFQISNSPIPIINYTKLESANYLFIYLDMKSIQPEHIT